MLRRVQTLKELEHRVRTKGETLTFIETPYCNVQLVEQLIRHCSPDLKLCIASGISLKARYFSTRKLSAWRGNIPQIHKVPNDIPHRSVSSFAMALQTPIPALFSDQLGSYFPTEAEALLVS